MRKPRRPWLTRWYTARTLYGLSVAFALVGAAWIVVYTVIANANRAAFWTGGVWLMLAASYFLVARQLRRREQLGSDQELPGAGQDVLTLVRQGRKIEAIKRYRQVNPGIGLREAKHVIDEL